jgi:hypothetical protein
MALAGQKKYSQAAELLSRAFTAWQQDPWVRPVVASHAIGVAQTIAQQCNDEAVAAQLFQTLQRPFAVELLRERRSLALVDIARYSAPERINNNVRDALASYREFPVWRKDFLRQRLLAYHALKDPHAEEAAIELHEFLEHEPIRFEAGLHKTVPSVANR